MYIVTIKLFLSLGKSWRVFDEVLIKSKSFEKSDLIHACYNDTRRSAWIGQLIHLLNTAKC